MKWFKHPVFKTDIYSDDGQYRITGRRIAGNDFEFQAFRLKESKSREGYTIQGWEKLGKQTDIERAKKQCTL